MKKRAALYKLLIILVVGAMLFCARENVHVKNGREMLAAGELKEAVSELKLALQDNEEDLTAKALLFYAKCRQDKNITRYSTLLDIYMVAEIEQYGLLPAEEIEELKRGLMETYADGYGIETRDWKELTKLAAIAGTEGFALPDPADEDLNFVSFKTLSAAVAAKEGDKDAVLYLLSVIRDYKDSRYNLHLLATQSLLSVGKPALRPLEAEVTKRESLWSEDAEELLAVMKITELVAGIKQKMPSSRSVRKEDMDPRIYERYSLVAQDYVLIPDNNAWYFTYMNVDLGMPSYDYLESADENAPERLAYVRGIDPDRGENPFFITFYQWGESDWQQLAIVDTDNQSLDIFYSPMPVVSFLPTRAGYRIVTAGIGEITRYRMKVDWDNFKITREPYQEEGVVIAEIDLVWSDGFLTIQAPEVEEE